MPGINLRYSRPPDFCPTFIHDIEQIWRDLSGLMQITGKTAIRVYRQGDAFVAMTGGMDEFSLKTNLAEKSWGFR
jgi:hypothetical protein